MSRPPAAIYPLGEAAWTIELGDRVDRATNARVLALSAAIAAAGIRGVQEIVPAYAAVTLFFDPAAGDADGIRERLERLTRQEREPPTSRLPDLPTSRLLRIPTRYDGPDLDEVAERKGLTRDQVIQLHHAREYRVYLLGFAPGFAYLGDLDPALALPRRNVPRLRVPAGSVAIAGAQTAVYPLATPGGWHLLGTTELRLFDPGREPPVLLQPGDRVRFEAIR